MDESTDFRRNTSHVSIDKVEELIEVGLSASFIGVAAGAGFLLLFSIGPSCSHFPFVPTCHSREPRVSVRDVESGWGLNHFGNDLRMGILMRHCNIAIIILVKDLPSSYRSSRNFPANRAKRPDDRDQWSRGTELEPTSVEV